MYSTARVFKNSYSFEINGIPDKTVNASSPQFFDNVPILRNKKIQAIGITRYNAQVTTNNNFFITLVNGNEEQLLYNFPLAALREVTGIPQTSYLKLMLFNLYDISLMNSYWTINQTTTFSTKTFLYLITFYWE